MVPIKSYEPVTLAQFLKRRGDPSKHKVTLMKITPLISAYQRTLLLGFKLLCTEMWHFAFFARRKIMGACLFVVFFFFGFLLFFPGVIILSDRRRSREGSFVRKSKVLGFFFSEQKYWRVASPLPCSFPPPKSPDQNFEMAILFSIVKKFNNYAIEDDLNPHSPWGKGYKLWALPIVYIFTHCQRRFQGDMKGSFQGGREFPKEGELDFQVLLKRRPETKWKTGFLTWKWGATLKLKTNRNYYLYEGVVPSAIPRSLH